jgi:hypothetical protein
MHFLFEGVFAFLRGVLQKQVYRTWFFDGLNVVEVWFNVVTRRTFLDR